MDAFVKTRRNRRIIVETREEQKDGFDSSSAVSHHATVAQEQSRSICPSTCKLTTSAASRSHDRDSVGSPFHHLGSECEDRYSNCSSPLSDSSFSGSSSDDDFSMQLESYHKGLPSRWLNGFYSNGNSVQVSPLLTLDADVMAQVLTFLGPSEILNILTMPLSKEWQKNYGSHQDLWKTLCLVEPFKANIRDDSDDDSSNDSFSSLPFEPAVKNIFGEYRLMYTSFVRCLRYLERIKEDARSGRALSVIDYGQSGFPHFGVSKSLKKFLSKRHGSSLSDSKVEASDADIHANPVGVTDDGYRKVRLENSQSLSQVFTLFHQC